MHYLLLLPPLLLIRTNIDILRYSEDINMDIFEGIASIHTNVISELSSSD
jgi:hypothetical protein